MAFNIAHNQTDGFNIAPTGIEDDGSYNTTVTGKVGVDLNEHFRLETVLRVVDRMSETDNQFTQFVTDGNNRSDGRDVAGRVTLLGEFMDGALTSKVQYSGSRTELVSFFGNPALFFGSQATRLNYSWQTDYRFSSDMLGGTNHTITGFIEQETQQFFQFGPFAAPLLLGRLERDMTGIAGEYRIEFGETSSLSGALRHDINDTFDDATTWRITGSHRLVNSDTRFHASVGRGVTNPTMIEQFGFFPPFVGNPNLTPESSISWDAGVEQAFHDGRLVIDVTYFSAVLEDEIVTRFILGANTPINLVGESKRQGVEVSATWNPNENWSFNGSYTYTDSEEPSGIAEIRRPHHQASASLTHNFSDGRAHITLNALYNGKMPDTVFTFPVSGRTILDDFFVVGVTGSYEVHEGVELYGRITNLFDEDYQEVFSFETAGLAAYAGIRVKFGHNAR
ncbi:MAG: TonB-dependent receptor [Rhizobiales bacterium]|nr:TonB-dependent receptor [Hyphomicrobiales bacterium]